MYESLFTLLKKPTLWQRSEAPFWDDEHISKGMLKAHLDPDVDAASRKKETIEKAIQWISEQIGQNKTILDLGCGPGLYTKKFSEMGHTVTGIDYSRRSIDYALSHDPKTHYRYQNYLTLTDTQAYDVVLLIYGDYAALTAQERKILLHNVYRALKPGGLFLFDVFTQQYFSKKESRNEWSFQPEGGFFCEKPHALLETSYFYENGTVRADCYTVITKEKAIRHIVWDTAFTKSSLLAETENTGLTLHCAYDDVCGTPYSGKADTLCFLMRKN